MSITREEFEKYIKDARQKYLKQEIATTEYIRNIWARAANRLRDYVLTIPESLKRKYYNELLAYIEIITQELNDETIKAISMGQKIAIDIHKENAQKIFEEISNGIWEQSEVEALFATVNERALLALANRTEAYGLKVSDRVWKLSADAREELKRALEDAVATGKDPRKLAKEIQHLLNPGVWTPLRKETRKRLGVSKDVSMEAMRLAVTEMQNAGHEGAIASYSLLPTCKGFYWKLSNSHPIEDICDVYAKHNGDGFWKKEEVPVKPHPWCRCYVVPVMEAPQDVVQKMKTWLNNPLAAPEIEGWYQQVKPFLPKPLRAPGLAGKIEKGQTPKTKNLEWRRAKTHEEAIEIAKELGLTLVYYDKETMSLRIANLMNKALFNILRDFPQLKNSPYFKRADGALLASYFRFLREKYPEEKENKDRCFLEKKYWDEFKKYWQRELAEFLKTNVIALYSPWAGLVIINYKYGRPGSYKKLQEVCKREAISGFSPANCNKPIAVIYHEIGHAIHFALNLVRYETINDDFIKGKWELFKAMSLEEQMKILGKYAGTGAQEMLAEAWASYCMEKYEKNGKAPDFAREIGEYIEKKLKEMK